MCNVVIYYYDRKEEELYVHTLYVHTHTIHVAQNFHS